MLDYNPTKSKAWAAAAGPFAIEMNETRESCESCLTNPNAKVRCAALLALQHRWKLAEELAPTCERFVFADPDPDVRAVAISCLAGCYSGSDDKRVGSLAAADCA